jgi:hypothetical protein
MKKNKNKKIDNFKIKKNKNTKKIDNFFFIFYFFTKK